MIDLTEYQAQIKQFYTPEVAADLLTYSREALVAEVGEVVGLRAKRRRGDAGLQDATAYREAVVLEMGDVLFSLASLYNDSDVPFVIHSLHYAPGALRLSAVTIRLDNAIERVFMLNTDWVAAELLSYLWLYVAGTRLQFDTLEHIARVNIGKLTARQAAGTIRGSGDDR